MKRKIGVWILNSLLLLSGTITFLHAQQIRPDENPLFNGERTFTAGFALGTNISQIDGDNLSGYYKFGLNAGPVVNVNFTPKIAFSFELLYSQKGSRSVGGNYTTVGGTSFYEYRIHLNYAEVPLILYYNLQPKYQFGIGASYNQLISSKETLDDGVNPITTFDNDTEYPFNKSNIDALISGSIVLWQGLVLQARYQYSITPIRKFEHIPQGFGIGNQVNNSFAIRFIYLF